MYRLKRLIIVTGANKGLGKAFYDRFISEKNEDIIISISRIISEDQQQLIDKKSSKFVFIPIEVLPCYITDQVLFKVDNEKYLH